MALPNLDINAGAAPLLWSNVQDAFDKINSNFTSLDITIAGYSGETVDLTQLTTDISPKYTDQRSIGSFTNQWKNIYTGAWSDTAGSLYSTTGAELNGLWAGSAQIKGKGLTIDLPEGSTVNNELIIDPAKAGFRAVQVDDLNRVSASVVIDTLNLNSGTAMQLVVDSSAESITINNTGVTSLIGTAGQIGISGSTGAVTLTNLGVVSVVAGDGMTVASTLVGGKGTVTVTNDGIRGIEVVSGLSLSIDSETKVATINNISPNIVQDVFKTVNVTGEVSLVADGNNDQLTYLIGNGMSISTNPGANEITFTNTGVTSIGGSTGISFSSSTGSVTVTNTGVTSLVAGDGISVSASTGGITVANTRLGFTSIAVSGQSSILADNTTDTLVLTGGFGINLTTNPTNDSIVFSINNEFDLMGSVFANNSTMLVDAVNGKITGPVYANIFTNLIDSADSSAIVVTPLTQFSSDVIIENDLTVNGIINGYIKTTTLKAVVAASTDFADFKTRIAAL